MSTEPYSDEEMQAIFEQVSLGKTVYEACEAVGYEVIRLEVTLNDLETRIYIVDLACVATDKKAKGLTLP